MGVREFTEGELDVHGVYDKALDAHSDFEESEDEAAYFGAEVRELHERIDRREAYVASEHRAANPDMSATGFKDYISEVLVQDEELQDLRDKLNEAMKQRDKCQAHADAKKYEVRVHVARMEELAGLLRLYAETRAASRASREAD